MEYQDFNIKPQNLKEHCCTCLNKLRDDKHEIDDMAPDLLQVFQQFTGHEYITNNDLYPKCVCAKCYEKVETIAEFQSMSKKSLLFLEELIKSFTTEPSSNLTQHEKHNDNIAKEISSHVSNTEKLAFNIENYKFDDPLLYNDGFEEVLIKSDPNENEELLDTLNEYVLNKFVPSLPDEEAISVNDELKPRNIKRCFRCDKCEQSFDKKRQLSSHMDKEHHEKKLTLKIHCKYGCGKTFRLKPTAEKHYKKIHQIELNNTSNTLGKSETFTKDISLKTKIKEKLQQLGCSLELERKQQTKTGNKIGVSSNCVIKPTCPICHKNFSSASGLNVHMRLHLDERPFQCDKCNRGFNKRALLTNHLKEIHAEVPIEIICKYGCGRVFQRQDSAMNHYRLKHILPLKGIKPDYTRVCEECGKVCKNISILKEHRNIHLPPEERPYKCEQCGKRFSMKKNLTIHLMRHAGVKKFECTICGLRTTTARELRLHMNYHTKELRVECPICSKAFNSPGNMKRHEQVVHQGIKKYSCRFCNESFGKPDTLKHHEMRHTGEKPHKCELCPRSFIQLVALKAHMKTHNKPTKLPALDQHVVEEESEVIIDVRHLL